MLLALLTPALALVCLVVLQMIEASLQEEGPRRPGPGTPSTPVLGVPSSARSRH